MELYVIFGLCIVELDLYLERKKMQKNPIKLVSLKKEKLKKSEGNYE